MTAGLTAARAAAALDAAITGTYVQVHVGDPGAAGTNNQASVTARQPITIGAASGGTKTATSQPQWASWGGSNQTITHISLWSAASGGTFSDSIQLAAAVAVVSGGTLTLTSCQWTLAPIAA